MTTIIGIAAPVAIIVLVLVVLPAVTRAVATRRRAQDLFEKLVAMPPSVAEGPFGVTAPHPGEALIRREVEKGEIPIDLIVSAAKAAGFHAAMTVESVAPARPAGQQSGPRSPGSGGSGEASQEAGEANRPPPVFSGPPTDGEVLFG